MAKISKAILVLIDIEEEVELVVGLVAGVCRADTGAIFVVGMRDRCMGRCKVGFGLLCGR